MTPAPAPAPSDRQKSHYERIHDAYEAHYYDAASMAYRQEFIYDPMFAGVDFNGLRVADLASGSGHNSLALRARFPDVRVEGFDISAKAVEAYRANVGTEAHQIDLTRGYEGDAAYDAAMFVGGLHHCVADLPGTLRTVAGMLRPGGWFLMFEPNNRYVLEAARKVWYRLDGYFDSATEAALDHDRLLDLADGLFRLVDVRHFGGPAYFLIYNSLVFRVPPRWKTAAAPPLVAAERLYNRIGGRIWHPVFVARWRRV